MEDIDNTRDETFDERLKVIVMVLHIHLMTKYHLTHYLEFNNATLGPLKDGDLSDAQKLDLINPSDPLVWFLVSVLHCLNKLRNRLAYDPAVIVTDQERKIFLSVATLKVVRKKILQKDDAMSVMECFAIFAGMIMLYAASRDGIKQLVNAGKNHKVV